MINRLPRRTGEAVIFLHSGIYIPRKENKAFLLFAERVDIWTHGDRHGVNVERVPTRETVNAAGDDHKARVLIIALNGEDARHLLAAGDESAGARRDDAHGVDLHPVRLLAEGVVRKTLRDRNVFGPQRRISGVEEILLVRALPEIGGLAKEGELVFRECEFRLAGAERDERLKPVRRKAPGGERAGARVEVFCVVGKRSLAVHEPPPTIRPYR